jgi:hypothetical protein
MADNNDNLMLLVALDPQWMIKELAEAWGDRLRRQGKMAMIDVDNGDTQEVELTTEDFKVVIHVTPKKKRG